MRVFGTFKVRLWGPSPVGPALWSLRVPGRDGYVFTQPSSAGYRPVAKIGWQVRDLRTARTLACLLSLRPASSWPTLTSAARPSHWASSRRLPAGPAHGAFSLGRAPAAGRGSAADPASPVRCTGAGRGETSSVGSKSPSALTAARTEPSGSAATARRLRRPVISAATAAIAFTAIANAKATPRPWWNG